MKKTMVKFLLQNAGQFNWSIQGLGMLRLYLSDEVRLHVWDSRYKIDNVSPLHDHPWHFESSVIAGKVRQNRFIEISTPTFGRATVEQYNCAMIKCGENACTLEDPKKVFLLKTYEEYPEGRDYYQSKTEIHESFPEDGSVTLVKRVFSENRDNARVFWKGDDGFVSAEPRAATKEEVNVITQYALQRWF